MSFVVFVDSRVADIDSLVAALDPTVQIFVLDAESDGIAQMVRALEGICSLDALHIVSHGSSGALDLGSTVLTEGLLDDYRTELSQIGASLSQDGDILLYGCNVAQGETGAGFIAQLAAYTGAQVAASTDYTGALALGGDWVLEAATGVIESNTLVIGSYAGLLNHVPGGPGAQLSSFENNLEALDSNVENLQDRVGQVKEIIESVETILNIPENIKELCDIIGRLADSGALMAKALQKTAALKAIAGTFEIALRNISTEVGNIERIAGDIDDQLEPYKDAVGDAKDYIEDTIEPALDVTRDRLGQAIRSVADANDGVALAHQAVSLLSGGTPIAINFSKQG